MTDTHDPRPCLRRWADQDDGWAVRAALFAFLGNEGAGWDVIDSRVGKKGFEGLWWW
ncbi:MAG: hypothetical protein AAFP13_01285 [Pseudomonadota bacterium]